MMPMLQGHARILSISKTMPEISGYLVAPTMLKIQLLVIWMIYGCLIPPFNNGAEWVEANYIMQQL